MPDLTVLPGGIEITEYPTGAIRIQRAPLSVIVIARTERDDFLKAMIALKMKDMP